MNDYNWFECLELERENKEKEQFILSKGFTTLFIDKLKKLKQFDYFYKKIKKLEEKGQK
jgi:hypothetical protein